MPSNKRSRNKKSTNNTVMTAVAALLKQQTLHSAPNAIPDVPFPIRGRHKVYTFWETIIGPVIQYSITEQDFAIKLTANSFTNLNGSLSNVCDSYRFNCVKITFNPYTGVLNNSASAVPPITTAIDPDDATVLTVANLKQYDTSLTVPVGTFFERTFVPKMAVGAFGSAVFGSFAQARMWVDMANLTVEWYGLKGGIPGASNGPSNAYETEITLCYSVRQVR